MEHKRGRKLEKFFAFNLPELIHNISYESKSRAGNVRSARNALRVASKQSASFRVITRLRYFVREIAP